MKYLTTNPNNPFSDEYCKNQLDLFLSPSSRHPHTLDGVEYIPEHVSLAVISDLFTKHLASDQLVPIFRKDNQTWMSITRMEVQSMWVPLLLAKGKVGTSGLGLGYFPLLAARKPEVKEVHVFEIDERVIKLFRAIHADVHPSILEKIVIHPLSFYSISNERFDFFFADHYRTGCADELVSDVRPFLSQNPGVKRYRGWSMEVAMLQAFESGLISMRQICPEDKALLHRFVSSGLANICRVSSMETEYLESFVKVYKKGGMR